MRSGHDILIRIKRAVLAGRYRLTEKALAEVESDNLSEMDAIESILNAQAILKTLRSQSFLREGPEKLYVILGWTLDGILVYTKVKLLRRPGADVYCFLISAKRAE